ncbi:MAG: ABC transporter permease, partial [Sphingomonadales bacterium]
MFKNYIVTALRNFWKNKLYSFINIGGLAIGLTVFVFANLFANYESTHDVFFENSERIYAIKSNFNPAAELGVVSINSTYTAVGPLIKQEVPEIEKVARTAWTDLIINRQEVKFYQSVHLVEPEFFDIFQFEYLYGNVSQAMPDTNSVVLTESTAVKYFGRTNVLGEILTLNNERDLRVTGVIKDLPRNSHLAQNMFDDETLEMIINYEIFHDIFGTEPAGNWSNLSTSLRIYVRLPEGASPENLKARLNNILDSFAPERVKNVITSIDFRRLKDMNLLAWQAIGIPAILIMRFLGFLVLTIACINFINLATAQALGRAREIGIRKTMGASRARLAVQFLVEAVVISFFALLIAVAVIEYALPAFNSATNKAMIFSYFSDLSMTAFLILTVIGVGLFSGSFPAFLLARLDASQALHGTMALGRWSLFFRKFLVISQNAFSVFLIISVMVAYLQINNVKNQNLGFNSENTMLLTRIDREGVNENFETLKAELSRVPGVTSVAGASQYPYDQSNNTRTFGLIPGDEATKVVLNRISVDYNFLETLQIPLLAGREFSKAFAADLIGQDQAEDNSRTTNVIISRLAATQFGWET